jgi:hypothetical protein
VTPPAAYTSDEDDEKSPLMDEVPRGVIDRSSSRSLYGRDSASARILGANPLPFGHADWAAHQVFDVGPARPESAKGGLEMTAGNRRVTYKPPVIVVESAPGQPPMLHIPLTDGLVASVLAQGVGVRTDGTDGVTADGASIPTTSDSKVIQFVYVWLIFII